MSETPLPPLDPYRLLGILRSASADDVKRAYREAAKLLHPDRNPDAATAAEPRFQRLVEAYQILSDPERRAAWDAAHASVEAAEVAGEAQRRATLAAAEAATKAATGVIQGVTRVVGGALEQVRAGVERRWALGKDLRYTVPVTFAEALLGCEKTVTFEAPVRCAACEGRGSVKDEEGARVACPPCGGEGVVVGERRFALEIPPGTEPGRVTRIPKGGTPGARGGPEGDLTFVVEVAAHPYLTREDDDLRCRVPVPATTALAGGRVRVPTLEGSTVIEVPAGLETGQVFRLGGRGGLRPDGSRGDLKITVEVELPAVVPEAVRRLLEEAERQDPAAVFPRSTAFRTGLEGDHG